MQKKNKKGATLGVAILSAIGIFIIGLMFVNFIMPEVTNFRTDMSCSDAGNIHDGVKITCLVGDATIPLFIVAVMSLGIGIVTRRFIF